MGGAAGAEPPSAAPQPEQNVAVDRAGRPHCVQNRVAMAPEGNSFRDLNPPTGVSGLSPAALRAQRCAE